MIRLVRALRCSVNGTETPETTILEGEKTIHILISDFPAFLPAAPHSTGELLAVHRDLGKGPNSRRYSGKFGLIHFLADISDLGVKTSIADVRDLEV